MVTGTLTGGEDGEEEDDACAAGFFDAELRDTKHAAATIASTETPRTREDPARPELSPARMSIGRPVPDMAQQISSRRRNTRNQQSDERLWKLLWNRSRTHIRPKS